jgi:DNA-binding transcriptional LysR family regulator
LLDTHQLNIFLVAAETLNFSRTAERLHMTQPSITQHIHALEARFGLPLFIRSGHRLALTQAGLALVPLAKEMVVLSVRTDEVMESLKGEVNGELIVGCSTTPGRYILPLILSNFMKKYPRVSATCAVTNRRNAVQMLCDGHVHVAFAGVPESNSDVEFRKFICEPVVLIAPLSHSWSEKGEIDPEELFGGAFIFREQDSGTYCVVKTGLASTGIQIGDLRRVLTLGSSEAITYAVQEGIGVGFVTQIVLSQMSVKNIRVIKIKGIDLHQDIYIGQSWRRPATSAQTAFWDFVKDFQYESSIPPEFLPIPV